MNVIKNVLVILFVVTVCEVCAAFNCYDCDLPYIYDDDDEECLKPGDSTDTEQCNSYCSTAVMFSNDDLTSVTRSCHPICREIDYIHSGTGGKKRAVNLINATAKRTIQLLMV
ncbi:uncharacterized protein LOC102806065 [Saccoglossus kowalevskii]|uniref:Uncharacterized protein LOC102806065 n=1 Tax=Saccoglossus kowalevskii TaxID=10224 RepID=A0ABM0MRS1_SACKO|nr:PREDICTED: uncharacterized protein LOC102806065 [Saccoglossus kowalevskii]